MEVLLREAADAAAGPAARGRALRPHRLVGGVWGHWDVAGHTHELRNVHLAPARRPGRTRRRSEGPRHELLDEHVLSPRRGCDRPRKCVKSLKVQLLQLVHDQEPGSVVCDGMLVDGGPVHTPAAAAATAPVDNPSTASEGLLYCLVSSGGTFKADNITFSVRTMLDERAHSLPVSLEAPFLVARILQHLVDS